MKSEQIVLLAKSGLSSSHSGRKPRKERPNNKPKKPVSRPVGTKCHICGKKGHWAPECCSKTNGKDDSYYPKGSVNLAIENPQPLEECEVGQMLMASSDSILSTGILLDYGATSHMFMSCDHFIKYTESSDEFMTIGGHNHVPVAGQGSVYFSALLPKGYFNITLHDVLHIPYLGANLISLGALYCQGVSVKSLNNGLVLSKNSEGLFRASLTGSTGTLYYIQCRPLASNIAYLAGTPGSMCL